MHDRLYSILVDKEEYGWKSIMLDLIRQEGMDPWDVDVSLLSKRYVERLREMKEQDLQVGGKVVLAAAILLRIKSKRLVGDDVNEFDRLLASSEMSEDQFYDGLEQELSLKEDKPEKESYELLPRMPQARRRKVSVFDLVKALEKALEVKKRRVLNNMPPPIPLPKRKFDVTAAIGSLLHRLRSLFSTKKSLTFSSLLRTGEKEEKVYTFIPLLHLSNQKEVELEQDGPFGEISIRRAEGENV
ncbi:segregation/condensation protein A [Candidatus Woesearchaeota archaeon]|nr:MAG: segregation/condensation protein A [Candidatus Woesearchaeota archaeon]